MFDAYLRKRILYTLWLVLFKIKFELGIQMLLGRRLDYDAVLMRREGIVARVVNLFETSLESFAVVNLIPIQH